MEPKNTKNLKNMSWKREKDRRPCADADNYQWVRNRELWRADHTDAGEIVPRKLWGTTGSTIHQPGDRKQHKTCPERAGEAPDFRPWSYPDELCLWVSDSRPPVWGNPAGAHPSPVLRRRGATHEPRALLDMITVVRGGRTDKRCFTERRLVCWWHNEGNSVWAEGKSWEGHFSLQPKT